MILSLGVTSKNFIFQEYKSKTRPIFSNLPFKLAVLIELVIQDLIQMSSNILRRYGSLKDRLSALSEANAGLNVPKPTLTPLPEYIVDYKCRVNHLLPQLENESKILIDVLVKSEFSEIRN